MTNKVNTEEKKQKPLVILLKKLFNFVLLRDELRILKHYSNSFLKAATICRQYPQSPDGVFSTLSFLKRGENVLWRKNPLIKTGLLFRIFYRIFLLSTMLWLLFSLYTLFERGFFVLYVKNIVITTVELIKTNGEITPESIFLTDTMFFELFKTKLTYIGVWLLVNLFLIKRATYSKIYQRTQKLIKLITGAGYIKEETLKNNPEHFVLWTPVGILLDVESRTHEEAEKDTSLWTQLEMIAGKADTHSSRHLFFVNVGFELPEYLEYAYDKDGSAKTYLEDPSKKRK